MRLSRVSCAAVAALAAVGGLIAATTSASAQEVTRPPARIGARPALPAGSREIGQLAPARTLQLEITLKGRNQAALPSFIAALSNRKSPLFHHYLTPAQYGNMFGASKEQVATVDAALRSVGLVPGSAGPNRLIIPVRTTAAAAERAFGTTLVTYRLAGGREVYANSRAPRLPGAAAAYVQAVAGLDNIVQWSSQAVLPRGERAVISAADRLGSARASSPEATGPQPCTAAKDVTEEYSGSNTANELATYYGFDPLYAAGDLGQGVHIALFELSTNATSNISTYEKCYGIKTTVNYLKIDGGAANSSSGQEEATLDIEDAAGLAPDATIDVYQTASSTDAEYLAGFNAIFSADKDKVVSTSWGTCEEVYIASGETSFLQSEQKLFEEAASQGQTVFAAAGDDGSTGCVRTGEYVSTLSPGDPGSQPYVIGVGGTTITKKTQTVWNESANEAGAGGGGLSIWCMPSYQDNKAITGVISKYSKTGSGCSDKGAYVREEPDVSADADPYSGYVIYDNSDSDGGWTDIGGTSAAAPLWAAVAAIIDASAFCTQYDSGAAGVQAVPLYEVVAAAVGAGYIWATGEALTDVTEGNNDYTPSGYTGGLYPATKGYDMASGLGTPVVSGYADGAPSNFDPGLAALMCYALGTKNTSASITSLSPSSGAAKKSHKITITGKGFLTIAGAEVVYIETTKTLVAATCTSSTKCTATLPAEKAGTYDLQLDSLGGFVATNTKTFKYTS